MHRFTHELNLFPDVALADDAIAIIRDAIIVIYSHAKKSIPRWVNDNTDQGWVGGGGVRFFGNMYSTPVGLDEHAPDTIKITYTYKDHENIREILPAGTDPTPHVANLIDTIGLPISAIKVYRVEEVIKEVRFPMDQIRGIYPVCAANPRQTRLADPRRYANEGQAINHNHKTTCICLIGRYKEKSSLQ